MKVKQIAVVAKSINKKFDSTVMKRYVFRLLLQGKYAVPGGGIEDFCTILTNSSKPDEEKIADAVKALAAHFSGSFTSIDNSYYNYVTTLKQTDFSENCKLLFMFSTTKALYHRILQQSYEQLPKANNLTICSKELFPLGFPHLPESNFQSTIKVQKKITYSTNYPLVFKFCRFVNNSKKLFKIIKNF